MPANTPRLETERLVLRRFTPADVEPLFSLMRDREVNTFLPWFPAQTLAEAEEAVGKVDREGRSAPDNTRR